MRAFGGQKAQMCHSQRYPRAKEPLRDPCLKRGICMNFSAGPCTQVNMAPAKLLFRFHSEAPHRHSALPLNSGGSSLTKRLHFQKVLHVLKCKCSISCTTSTSLIFASGSSPLSSLRGLLQSSYSVPDPLLAPAVTSQPRHRSSPQGRGHLGRHRPVSRGRHRATWQPRAQSSSLSPAMEPAAGPSRTAVLSCSSLGRLHAGADVLWDPGTVQPRAGGRALGDPRPCAPEGFFPCSYSGAFTINWQGRFVSTETRADGL